MDFTDNDYWKGIILYGLNAATYKIALGQTLLTLADSQNHVVSWEELSKNYLEQYVHRLQKEMIPQQSNSNRLTVMERIVMKLKNNSITFDQAVKEVGETAFKDVIPRFQTIGTDRLIVANKFYDIEQGKRLILKDSIFNIAENYRVEANDEISSRWSLLEGAFTLQQGQYQLSNDIRGIYLRNGTKRVNLTSNVSFLNGYQNNKCFYCAEAMQTGDIHVDHVLPRQILNHDEIWNLVLSHSSCNLNKSDHVVGSHYMQKLIARNENIMGSNHPWKKKISDALGRTANKRKASLELHYDNVKKVLNNDWWGGIESYNPETDPFYRSLITKLNNK